MQGYLIDPKARTITEVNYDGSLQSIYKLLDCRTIEAAPINDHTECSVFVDEEGLFTEERPLYAFQFMGGHQPMVGRALVIGPTDDEGKTLEPDDIDIETLYRITMFGTIG